MTSDTALNFEDLGDSKYEAYDDASLSEEDRQRQEWMAQPAPYGRFKSGKPKKTPPKGSPKAKSTSATRKPKSNQPDYEEGISGIFQMAAFGLAMAGSNNKTLMADSVAVSKYGPGVASALAGLANERPEVAAVLDRVLAVGPYSAVIAAVAPLIIQVVANHGVKVPGAATSDELLAEAEAAQMAYAEQMANAA